MNVIRKIQRLARLFLRQSGPFWPDFYESGGVLKISPRVEFGGRSASADLPGRTASPAAFHRPAPDAAPEGLRA